MGYFTEELSDAGLGSEQLCFLVNSNSVYLEEQKTTGSLSAAVSSLTGESLVYLILKRQRRDSGGAFQKTVLYFWRV